MAFGKLTGESSKQMNLDEGSFLYVPNRIKCIIKKVSLISDISEKLSELDIHIHDLEEEQRKVNPFMRELPCAMDFLNDGIKNLKEIRLHWHKEQLDQELMREKYNSMRDSWNDMNEKKSWLDHVRLWSTVVDCKNSSETQNQESFLSAESKLEEGKGLFKSGGGVFAPFMKRSSSLTIDLDLGAVSVDQGSSLSVPVAEVGSIGVRVKENRGSISPSPQQPLVQRKMRRCWSPQLHTLFVDAIYKLGGLDTATPKQIREHMKVEGLTNDEVKSHLQKYRIHIRKVGKASTKPSGLPWFKGAQMASNSAKRVSANVGDDVEDETHDVKGKKVERHF